jgi:hypothetical protein
MVLDLKNKDMKRLNFKEFGIYTGICKKNRQIGDARESFADLLYLHANGIRAHALALKIFRSEGLVEYSDEEIALIRETAYKYCLPNFIDGLEDQLNNNQNNG